MSDAVKFLLVDDVEENLLALEALLEREGLEIHKARTGTAALELVLSHDFALAFIDVHMPQMDGFELAELIRGAERTKRLPIIFVTAGRPDQRRVFAGYETGAVDFLFKPVDPTILKHKADVFFSLARQNKEVERVVAEMKETLRLNEMFTAALGHDLRNPLAAVMTGAELLIRRAPDEATVTCAKRILASGNRMAQMIEQLLDLARARVAGGIPITPTQVNLQQLTERLITEQQVNGRPIGLEVVGNTQGYWDEARMGQVLSNLIGNAVKHGADSGPVKVHLDGRTAESVTITVSNSGTIDPAIMPYIFDPFRAGREAHRRADGLGLGLYIVDQIARVHGAKVCVRSTPETGTVFELTFPRKVVTQPAATNAMVTSGA